MVEMLKAQMSPDQLKAVQAQLHSAPGLSTQGGAVMISELQKGKLRTFWLCTRHCQAQSVGASMQSSRR